MAKKKFDKEVYLKLGLVFIAFCWVNIIKSQSLTYGEIRVGQNDEIKSKTHIGQVLEFDSVVTHDLYLITRDWFWEYYWKTKRVYSYGTDWTSGGGWDRWVLERFKPFKVDVLDHKVRAEVVMCKECCLVHKKVEDMVYVLEIYFRAGRVKVLMTDFYAVDSQVYINTITTENGIIKSDFETMLRVRPLEQEFAIITLSLQEYINDAVQEKLKKRVRYSPKFDDW